MVSIPCIYQTHSAERGIPILIDFFLALTYVINVYLAPQTLLIVSEYYYYLNEWVRCRWNLTLVSESLLDLKEGKVWYCVLLGCAHTVIEWNWMKSSDVWFVCKGSLSLSVCLLEKYVAMRYMSFIWMTGESSCLPTKPGRFQRWCICVEVCCPWTFISKWKSSSFCSVQGIYCPKISALE